MNKKYCISIDRNSLETDKDLLAFAIERYKAGARVCVLSDREFTEDEQAFIKEELEGRAPRTGSKIEFTFFNSEFKPTESVTCIGDYYVTMFEIVKLNGKDKDFVVLVTNEQLSLEMRAVVSISKLDFALITKELDNEK